MIVILLVLFGIFLITFNIISLKKDKKSDFKTVLNNQEENITDIDIKIGTIRKEFAETILELQKEILAVKELVNYEEKIEQKAVVNDILDNNINEELVENNINKEVVVNNSLENDNNYLLNNNKTIEVQGLLAKGTKIDDICKKLKIGKGEVLLIKDLYLK